MAMMQVAASRICNTLSFATIVPPVISGRATTAYCMPLSLPEGNWPCITSWRLAVVYVNTSSLRYNDRLKLRPSFFELVILIQIISFKKSVKASCVIVLPSRLYIVVANAFSIFKILL